MRWKLIFLAATAIVALLPATASAHLKAGQAFVVDNSAFGGGGGVISANPATGKETKVSANDMAVNASSQLFDSPYGIALAPSGKLVLVDTNAFDGGGVIGVNPATGRETEISGNDMAVNASSQFFAQPSGIAVQPSGRILVTDFASFGGLGGVISVNPPDGRESELSGNDLAVNSSSQFFETPISIALSPSGKIYVLDEQAFDGSGGVISVNPASGKETEVSANNMAVNASSQFFDHPYGIRVAPNGKIMVLDNSAFLSGGVISVDPATGKETEVAANGLPVNSASQLFTSVEGLAFNAKGRILVADDMAFGGSGGLISVNPANGKESLTSANSQAVNSSSDFYDAPYGLAIVPQPPVTKVSTASISPKKGRATFSFRSSGTPASAFQCRLRRPRDVSSSFARCHSPRSFKNLPAGSYTFAVRALGVSGPDRTPATRKFSIG
jgi:hypothetical protein